MANSAISGSSAGRLVLLCCALLGAWGLTVAPPAIAHEDEAAHEREIEQHKKQIHELLQLARKLQAADRHDEARELITKAERMQKALREHEKRDGAEGMERSIKILKGLHHGIEALHALGGHAEAAAHLEEIASGLRHRIEDEKADGKKHRKDREKQGRNEREAAEKQLELLHFGHRVLREAKRLDCAEILEHAAHALELRIKSRNDEAARDVYRSAPKRPAVSECLGLAAEILADKGEKRKAAWLTGLAKKWNRKGRKERERMRKPTPRPTEHRAKTAYDLEVMSMAIPALLEADREELAHKVEFALRWREMWLEGTRGEAVHAVRRKSPSPGNLAEILGHAAHLWRTFDRPDKAAWLERVRDGLLEDAGLRKPRHRERDEAKDLQHFYRELELLQERLKRMREQIRDAAR